MKARTTDDIEDYNPKKLYINNYIVLLSNNLFD